jgi:hypothetical protein
MAFDPNLPGNHTQVSSAELRSQFTGLKALIDAVPAGPQGPPGNDGAPGAEGRGIDEVYDSGDGRAMVRMSDGATYGPFTIASGPPGPEGTGVSGFVDNGGGSFVIHTNDGQIYGPFTPPGGPEGPAGPEGRGITNVRDNGDGRAVVEMSDGSSYGPFSVASGPAGPGGPTGPQGPAGEVTGMQLTESINSAIAGTSANSNTVQPLGTPYADPEKEEMRQKINELIQALRR